MVKFLNEPKLSEHQADADFNQRRLVLLPVLKEFLSGHTLFYDKEVEVTFLHTGVSSLVCIIDSGTNKYVLKIPLSILTSGLEGTFLKAWENVGVHVPHIFEEGNIGNHFYTLMECIPTNTLAEKYSHEELLEKKIYEKLGVLLKKMHQVKTEGYSNIVNDKIHPQYETIATWFSCDTRSKEQFSYVQEKALLDESLHGSIEDVRTIIVSRVGDKKETVYCHNDFHTGNIFNTNPMTVFDPWPCFHHPYMDIARSIILASKDNVIDITQQFIEGYFAGEDCDRQLLQAFIILNIWVKLPYMHKTGKISTIETLKEYLVVTKKFL